MIMYGNRNFNLFTNDTFIYNTCKKWQLLLIFIATFYKRPYSNTLTFCKKSILQCIRIKKDSYIIMIALYISFAINTVHAYRMNCISWVY